MKYFVTTLAINEEYFKNSLEVFTDLHESTEDAIFNITTTSQDLDSFEAYTETTLEDFKQQYPRLQFTTLDSFNFAIEPLLNCEGHGFTFNVNLKVLAIKACLLSQKPFEYLIYMDSDWKVYTEFSESKIHRLFKEMDEAELDFLFERPARIGDDRVKPETSFYYQKIHDYDIGDNNLWDEAHVVNEQFLVFKNNWKLKVFTQKWEQMMWYSIANRINNYAEGFEIGISALEANMKWSWKMLSILQNSFYFYTKWTRVKHTKF